MLPVSDLLSVARDRASGSALRDQAPQRFGAAGGAPPVVVWNVCLHCNMTCPHCYAAAAGRPSPKDLSHEEALRLVDDLARNGVRMLVLSGGEPLLREDLLALAERARARGMVPQLSTNGVLIDAGTARRLARAGVAYVGVSVDGPRPFNDAYRGLEGATDAALAGLRHAKEASMRTGLRMTVTRANAGSVPAMIDRAKEVGADRFYLSHLLYSGRGFRIAHQDLDPEGSRALLLDLFGRAEALLDRGEPLRVVTGSNDSDGVLLLHWVRERHGKEAAARVERLLHERGGNSAGEKIVNVDHRGRVHPDQFWRSAVLGDVREQSFAEILAHPLRGALARREAYLKGRCGSCRYRAICRGSHRERALAVHRDLWAPDPACVMRDVEVLAGEPLPVEAEGPEA